MLRCHGCGCGRKYFASSRRLGFLAGTLLFGVKANGACLPFRRDDGMSKVPGQWRPEPGDVAGNPSVIPRQCCQAICNIVMIRAVKLVRRGTMWAVAPQGP